MMGWSPRYYIHVSWKSVQQFWKILKGFYHLCAYWPSWSCDLDHLYEIWFPVPKEAPHKIWLRLAKRFGGRCLKMVDDNNNDGRWSMGISSPTCMSLWLRSAKISCITCTCMRLLEFELLTRHLCCHSNQSKYW